MTNSHRRNSWLERLPRAAVWLAHRPAAAVLLFVVIGWLCYYPSLDGQFLWDDAFLIQNSQAIRSPALAGEVFRHYLNFESTAPFYRPVQNLSFIADYLLWEFEPYGYRLTNLLLHVANAGLLFLLLRRVLPKLWPAPAATPAAGRVTAPTAILALLLAVVWLVHPVHSAAVAYISGRADSLAMLFALLAWLAWERGDAALARRASPLVAPAWFGCGAVALTLAFCSKEIATIWLPIFGLYLLLACPAAPVRRRVLTFLCALAVLGGYALLRHLPAVPADAFVPAPPPMPPRLILMGRSLGDYAGLLLFPARLYMERQVFADYGKVATAGEQWGYHAMLLIGLLTLGGLIAGVRSRLPGQRLRQFGAGWFLLAWLPVSNLWVLNASVAEHWLYVPSVGFFLFLAGVAAAVPALSWSHRLPRLVWQGAPVALLAFLTLLGVRTNIRSADWFDDVTLYRQTLAAGAHSPRLRMMLALAQQRRGQMAESEAALRGLAAEFPNYGLLQVNLASLLLRTGRIPEGTAILHALRDSTSPAHRALQPVIWGNLLRLPGENADPAATLERISSLAERTPGSWELLEMKVRLLRQLDRPAEAEAAVIAYRANRPWHYAATMRLAGLSEERGDFARAEALLIEAGRLDVHEVASRRARALIRLRSNQPEAARALADEAIRRQPGQPQNYFVLAQVFTQLGRAQEAADATAHGERLRGASGIR